MQEPPWKKDKTLIAYFGEDPERDLETKANNLISGTLGQETRWYASDLI